MNDNFPILLNPQEEDTSPLRLLVPRCLFVEVPLYEDTQKHSTFNVWRSEHFIVTNYQLIYYKDNDITVSASILITINLDC